MVCQECVILLNFEETLFVKSIFVLLIYLFDVHHFILFFSLIKFCDELESSTLITKR